MSAASAQPLRGLALAVAALGITLAVFMEVLDLTVVSASIPAISGGLSASASEGIWVVSSYALGAAVVQPLTGWLAQRFGEVRVFAVSIFLFTMASLMCGLALNLPLLVLARLVQGLVSGVMMPLSQSLLLANAPERWRSISLSLWGMTIMAAPIFGPIIGGMISDNYSWRWIFFLNLPIGLFSTVVVWWLMRNRETPIRRVPVDYIGLALMTIGIGALQMVLDNGHLLGWLDSPLIVSLIVIVVIATALFGTFECRQEHPIILFSLFKSWNFSAAIFCILLASAATTCVLILTPVNLQMVENYTATDAGFASAGFGMGSILTAVLIGPVLQRVPTRSFLVAGCILNAISYALIAHLPAHVGFWQQFWPRVLFGISSMAFFLTIFDVATRSAPAGELASASGLIGFMRMFGISAGTATWVTLWDQRSDVHSTIFLNRFDPAHIVSMSDSTLKTLLTSGQAHELTIVKGLAQIQARALAFNDICLIGAMLFLLLIPLCVLLRPVEGRLTGSSGVH